MKRQVAFAFHHLTILTACGRAAIVARPQCEVTSTTGETPRDSKQRMGVYSSTSQVALPAFRFVTSRYKSSRLRLAPLSAASAFLSGTLRRCDVIFGCVDSYRERDELERFMRRFLIPYIDIGMDVHGAPANCAVCQQRPPRAGNLPGIDGS